MITHIEKGRAMNHPTRVLAAVTAGLIILIGAAPVPAEIADSYEEALKMAAEHDVPVVLDFYTDW